LLVNARKNVDNIWVVELSKSGFIDVGLVDHFVFVREELESAFLVVNGGVDQENWESGVIDLVDYLNLRKDSFGVRMSGSRGRRD